jgi:large subunit ribosomal protein L17
MRHNKKFNHLSRTSAHRKAMLSNMTSSLITHKRIETTVAKAKALKMYAEPIINRAKNDTSHSRRMVFRKLQDKEAVNELFREIATKIMDRPGGYTRILKTGNRLGDNAEMCIIELVDYNENLLNLKSDKAKPKRKRTRRAGSASTSDAPKAEETKVDKAAPVKEETAKEESKEELPKAESPKEDAESTKTEPKAEATEKVDEAKKEDSTEDKTDKDEKSEK